MWFIDNLRRVFYYIGEPMKKLFASKRFGLAGLILAAGIAVAIYFYTQSVRTAALFFGVALVVLFLFWLINLAVRAKGRRRDAAFDAALSKAEGVSRLKSDWQDATSQLKAHGIDRYRLPFYVLIGEPQSGKSTTLKKSGLDLPLGDQKISGLGGTVNCDWWFTDKAVVLDTAGRLPFQESETDSAEWTAFLDLVASYRPRCPMNGVVAVIPCDALLNDSAEQHREKAQILKKALTDLQRELQIQFPVYVVLTKGDKISGYSEFFAGLDAREQRQILGWSRPNDRRETPFVAAEVAQAFDSIVARLRRKRVALLNDPDVARNTETVDRLFSFPDELETLRDSLQFYFEAMFPESILLPPLFLRGFYLTSGLQKGMPVVKACREWADRDANAPAPVMDEVSEVSLIMKPNEYQSDEELYPEVDRSLFISDLYLEKIFPEQGLIQASSTKVRRARLVQTLGFGTAAVLLIAGGLWFAAQFLSDQKKIASPIKTLEKAQELIDDESKSDKLNESLEFLTKIAEETDKGHSGHYYDILEGDLFGGGSAGQREEVGFLVGRAHRALAVSNILRPLLDDLEDRFKVDERRQKVADGLDGFSEYEAYRDEAVAFVKAMNEETGQSIIKLLETVTEGKDDGGKGLLSKLRGDEGILRGRVQEQLRILDELIVQDGKDERSITEPTAYSFWKELSGKERPLGPDSLPALEFLIEAMAKPWLSLNDFGFFGNDAITALEKRRDLVKCASDFETAYKALREWERKVDAEEGKNWKAWIGSGKPAEGGNEPAEGWLGRYRSMTKARKKLDDLLAGEGGFVSTEASKDALVETWRTFVAPLQDVLRDVSEKEARTNLITAISSIEAQIESKFKAERSQYRPSKNVIQGTDEKPRIHGDFADREAVDARTANILRSNDASPVDLDEVFKSPYETLTNYVKRISTNYIKPSGNEDESAWGRLSFVDSKNVRLRAIREAVHADVERIFTKLEVTDGYQKFLDLNHRGRDLHPLAGILDKGASNRLLSRDMNAKATRLVLTKLDGLARWADDKGLDKELRARIRSGTMAVAKDYLGKWDARWAPSGVYCSVWESFFRKSLQNRGLGEVQSALTRITRNLGAAFESWRENSILPTESSGSLFPYLAKFLDESLESVQMRVNSYPDDRAAGASQAHEFKRCLVELSRARTREELLKIKGDLETIETALVSSFDLFMVRDIKSLVTRLAGEREEDDKEQLVQKWEGIRLYCRSRFPFRPTGRDASPQEVQRFYGRSGTLAQFTKAYGEFKGPSISESSVQPYLEFLDSLKSFLGKPESGSFPPVKLQVHYLETTGDSYIGLMTKSGEKLGEPFHRDKTDWSHRMTWPRGGALTALSSPISSRVWDSSARATTTTSGSWSFLRLAAKARDVDTIDDWLGRVRVRFELLDESKRIELGLIKAGWDAPIPKLL